jgi:phage terminase large subunit-like protein
MRCGVITSGVGQRVQEYVDGVLSGDIIACDRVKDAARRYVSDLARESTQDFPYHFDAHWATSVCQFFPLMLRHSIGEFSGRPFELESWQLFAIWNIFGWKRDEDNSRRFRKVYWSMARKNGKSSVAAGLCLFLGAGDVDPSTGKPEAVGQILLTATKKEQAAVVYGEAQRMRDQSKYLTKMTDVKNETITFKNSLSYIRKVSSDKPFDGLNPHCVVMDELHAWGEYHRKFYDTMVTGSGSRTQPLHLIITTAGDDQSHLWLENYNYAVNVANGTFKDESLFAIIYELDETDDPADETKWIKANPNLGVSCSMDYLRQRWNEDKNTALGRNRFLRYHGNRIVTSTEKAFRLDAFDKCVGDFADWKQADAIGAGVDLGSRDDLAAYALCARFPIGSSSDGKAIYRYEIQCKTFIADDSKRDLSVMPFSEWVYTGELQKAQYPLDELQAQLVADLMEHEVRTIAYDPYNGQQLGESLAKEGVVAARMAQNPANFNEAIRDFITLMEEGRLVFSRSKLLRWCANNAIIARDRQDRWMFDKRAVSDKIDPIVAAVMAYRICSLQPERSTGPLFIG